jgi:hypothetical protein
MHRVVAPRGAKDILYGQTPFGWRLSKDRSRLVEDREEQRVISVIRHMYFVGRVPMRDIVKRLKEMGVRNRRGRPFPLSRVFEIVHSTNTRPPEASPSGGRWSRRARARSQRRSG